MAVAGEPRSDGPAPARRPDEQRMAGPASWPTIVTPDATPRPAEVGAEAIARRIAEKSYACLDVTFEPAHGIVWCMTRADAASSFSPALLDEILDVQGLIRAAGATWRSSRGAPVRYFVAGSQQPGVYSLGGDLEFFAGCIRRGDRGGLQRYARACIEIVHANFTGLDLPILTVALIQGDALGGGFETALSCDIIVAEKSAKFGLPEILFNLFPGMGALSFLGRRLGIAQARRLVLSGRIYTAAELHDMGVIDVVAEDGKGEMALREHLARLSRKHAVHHAVAAAARHVQPLGFEELRDINDIWVETALGLSEADLKRMQVLAEAQVKRRAARTDGGGMPPAAE